MTSMILLALDKSSTLTLLSRALRAVGYQTVTAHEWEGVEKLMRESHPALVLLGEKLDGVKSSLIIEKLLTLYPTLPIVFLATKKSSALTREILRAGVSAYLEPPLNTDEIVDAVQSSLQRAGRTGDWVRQKIKGTTASLEKRINEMEVLLAVGRDLTGSLNLDHVLKNVVEAAVKLTRAEEGSLLLPDEETGELYMRASHNFEDGFARSFRLPVNDTLAGKVLDTGEALILNKEEGQKIKTAYLVQSLIYVPLKVDEKVIGVLGVDNRRHRLPFTKRDVLLISILADYAAIAIENARLYRSSENQRSKFEAVLSNMDDALMIVDEAGEIQLVNDAMCSALGFRPEDLLRKTALEIIPYDDFRTLFSLSEQAKEDEKKTVHCQEIGLNDERTFNAQYTKVDDVGAVITMQDISHLKELNRLKDNFVHTVSHDLRSPLTAVLGYAELLERVGTLNEQQKEFIRRIHSSVEDITDLINDLLDLGKIEAGFDTRREPIRIDKILRNTLENLEVQMPEKQHILEVNIDPNLPAVHGNPVRIRQMFDNLIGNAIKYTPSGKKISVDLLFEENQIIFKVADQGQGIPQEDQPHIFEKFYRASNISSDAAGTGLGLAIVKTIVESHNGRIWVESKINEGSTFFVVLPA